MHRSSIKIHDSGESLCTEGPKPKSKIEKKKEKISYLNRTKARMNFCGVKKLKKTHTSSLVL